VQGKRFTVEHLKILEGVNRDGANIFGHLANHQNRIEALEGSNKLLGPLIRTGAKQDERLAKLEERMNNQGEINVLLRDAVEGMKTPYGPAEVKVGEWPKGTPFLDADDANVELVRGLLTRAADKRDAFGSMLDDARNEIVKLKNHVTSLQEELRSNNNAIAERDARGQDAEVRLLAIQNARKILELATTLHAAKQALAILE
jgi:DNA repair exonuclease SbcCD ATPase subunit